MVPQPQGDSELKMWGNDFLVVPTVWGKCRGSDFKERGSVGESAGAVILKRRVQLGLRLEVSDREKYSSKFWISLNIFVHFNLSQRYGVEPRSGLVRQAKFCLQVVRCFFLGISRFCPTLTIDSA